jgi:hypothetical protein
VVSLKPAHTFANSYFIKPSFIIVWVHHFPGTLTITMGRPKMCLGNGRPTRFGWHWDGWQERSILATPGIKMADGCWTLEPRPALFQTITPDFCDSKHHIILLFLPARIPPTQRGHIIFFTTLKLTF